MSPIAIEEAGLNALQTQRQLLYDGWLLRVSPGKAKRARSVNAHFGSSLPLDAKIAHCESLYAARDLPALFRITPFVRPAELETALSARGYVAFDPTQVQALALARPPEFDLAPDLKREVVLESPPIAAFVAAVGEMRASSPEQQAAHLERLAGTPLATHSLLARIDGRPVACGQATLERDLAGVYDMVTANGWQGRGFASLIVAELLTWAWTHGAAHAYLQVNDDNAPARAVYRKFGFATVYEYHYRARPGECH
ncbi:MAG: GNAT family N-acetyltransferase [Casimicrobiaceae bacterium]